MPQDPVPPSRSLERLRKDAKRWREALAAGDTAARERYARVLGAVPAAPTLRDVQHALAREHGFAGWAALRQAVGDTSTARGQSTAISLEAYEEKARALFDAYRTGTPEAMERHYRHTWHRRGWRTMRAYIQLDLGRRPAAGGDEVEISPDDARQVIAIEHGFADWHELTAFVLGAPAGARLALRAVGLRRPHGREEARTILRSHDWDAIVEAMRREPSATLVANGQMTDAVLAVLARVDGLAALDLSGSRAVTDEGMRHLGRASGLRQLDLSGTAVTDVGLAVLRALPALETLSLAGTRVTDAGLAHLEGSQALERLNLLHTRTGDGALKALAGTPRLCHLATGQEVSDAGIRLLHELPAFRVWQGGEARMALLRDDSDPVHLVLRGTFTDRGLEHLRGLEGLSGLNLDDRRLAVTAAALEPLASLPRLVWLGVDATDEWMPGIAALPHLRFLMAQDTPAGDEGFVALSRSRTLEYIWGRRCHNLGRRGFQALARLPALRGLSVSCLNVDDEGLAALPSFPALRELMPMDVPDAGYRHIGRCPGLESLVLMYCRDTTDAATAHLTGLNRLASYFNSYTTITDRTPEILSGMDSLEEITFDTCHGLTDAGLARLARLPRLRRLRVSGGGATAALAAAFPPGVTSVGEW